MTEIIPFSAKYRFTSTAYSKILFLKCDASRFGRMISISGADLDLCCRTIIVTVVIHTIFHVAGNAFDMSWDAAVLLAHIEIFVSTENRHFSVAFLPSCGYSALLFLSENFDFIT